jgi:hypothetical protein
VLLDLANETELLFCGESAQGVEVPSGDAATLVFADDLLHAGSQFQQRQDFGNL